MIRQEMKMLVTFRTTSQAMEAELRCREKGFPGRLIPIPESISAECGLGWCAPAELYDRFKKFAAEGNIKFRDIHRCLI